MIAYRTHNASPRDCQLDPLEGGYLIPGGCTDVEPPEFNKETHTCSFIDDVWVVKEIPKPEPEPEPYEENYADKRLKEYGSLRAQIAFITENGLEAWQSKVAEIKKKYPKE